MNNINIDREIDAIENDDTLTEKEKRHAIREVEMEAGRWEDPMNVCGETPTFEIVEDDSYEY